MRVLLVDDEQAIVSLVATVLERRGFVTVAAATVRAAADDYVTKPFSVHEIAARIAVVGGPTGPARRRLMGGVGPVWGGAARRRPGTGRGRRELAGLSARTPATCHNNCTILVIEELATPLPAHFGFHHPPESTDVLVAVVNAHGEEVLEQPAPLIAAVPAIWGSSAAWVGRALWGASLLVRRESSVGSLTSRFGRAGRDADHGSGSGSVVDQSER